MTRPRRRRRPETPGPAGFLVVDKPPGWTSHDAVDAARRWLGTRRVGHLGTLDPLATGVLPLAVREATRLVTFLEGGGKTYVGTIRLGEETDTLDADGRVVRRHEGAFPEEAEVRQVLAEFVGDIEQLPPMYSAVKLGGVPLHRLAREGREVEREPKRVRIERLELVKYTHAAPAGPRPPAAGERPTLRGPCIEIEVDCSPGTYVRALAADAGARLGCGAHLAELRRTRSGPFDDTQAASSERLEEEAARGEISARIIPPVNALGFPALRLSPEELVRVRHGAEIELRGPALTPGERVSALGLTGELVAVLAVRPGRRARPLKVLRSVAAPT